MDHPADDVDLAAAATTRTAMFRALIATQQFGRDAPSGVHTAADTLAAWILDLDPDEQRLQRAPRLLVDGQWRRLRVGKAPEEWCGGLRRRPTPTGSSRSLAKSARRWLRSAGSSASWSHRRLKWPGGPRPWAGRAAAGSGLGVVAGGTGRR
jgi:hypothetical protein